MTDDNKTTPTPAPGLDLDAVEAAHARMTAGEWYVHVLPTSPASGLLVFDVGPSDDHPVATTSGTDTESVDEAEANAAGIVALKNAAPAMFAEVRALRAEVAKLNDREAGWRDLVDDERRKRIVAQQSLAEAKRLGRELVAALPEHTRDCGINNGRIDTCNCHALIAAALEAL